MINSLRILHMETIEQPSFANTLSVGSLLCMNFQRGMDFAGGMQLLHNTLDQGRVLLEGDMKTKASLKEKNTTISTFPDWRIFSIKVRNDSARDGSNKIRKICYYERWNNNLLS